MLQNEIGLKRWPAYSHPVKEEKRAYRLTEVFSATAYQIKAYHDARMEIGMDTVVREGNQCDYKYQVDCVHRHANRWPNCASIRFMDLDWQVKEFTSTFVSCKRLAGWYGIILNLNAVPLGRKLSKDWLIYKYK